jgi:hypothetical protein
MVDYVFKTKTNNNFLIIIEKPIDFVTYNVENIYMLVYAKYVAIYK